MGPAEALLLGKHHKATIVLKGKNKAQELVEAWKWWMNEHSELNAKRSHAIGGDIDPALYCFKPTGTALYYKTCSQ